LYNSSATRSYAADYTISSANTWEYKTITIPGDTTGTWLTTNGKGISLNFGIAAGTNYNGPAGSWTSSFLLASTSQTNLMATAGATFYITGVQFEVGSTASSFEHRLYPAELALCQRYYAKLGANPSGASTYQAYGAGGNQSNNTSQNIALVFPQYMRASPTIAYSGNIGVSAFGSYVTISGIGGAYTGVSSSLIQTSTPAVGSAGQGVVLLSNADATAFISLTAEL